MSYAFLAPPRQSRRYRDVARQQNLRWRMSYSIDGDDDYNHVMLVNVIAAAVLVGPSEVNVKP
jgi:hypothetical protein